MKQFSRVLGIFLLILAVAIAGFAVTIGSGCTGRAPGYVTGIPAPDDTVSAFFDSVCAERYEDACALVKGYFDLGLRNEPTEYYASALWSLLRRNYSWRTISDCLTDRTRGAVAVELTYPDLDALTADMNSDVNRLLTERVDPTQPAETYYDENGEYRPELIRDIYADVFAARLLRDELPMRSERIIINLEYADFAWKIVPDDALLAALSGDPS